MAGGRTADRWGLGDAGRGDAGAAADRADGDGRGAGSGGRSAAVGVVGSGGLCRADFWLLACWRRWRRAGAGSRGIGEGRSALRRIAPALGRPGWTVRTHVEPRAPLCTQIQELHRSSSAFRPLIRSGARSRPTLTRMQYAVQHAGSDAWCPRCARSRRACARSRRRRLRAAPRPVVGRRAPRAARGPTCPAARRENAMLLRPSAQSTLGSGLWAALGGSGLWALGSDGLRAPDTHA